MAKEVIMPALGMAQETGVLQQWLKAEGEEVAAGEPLMEVETDKAVVEVEAPASGVLGGVTADPGEEIPVGQVIAFILSAGEEVPTGPVVEPSEKSEAIPEENREPAPSAAHPIPAAAVESSPSGKLLASPKARRLAAEHGLDLGSLLGSGPEGAVLAVDVQAAIDRQAESPPVVPSAGPVEPASFVWKTMVKRLSQSWTQAPHFFLSADARADELIRWRDETQQRAEEKITYTDLFVMVTSVALCEHPRLNARWEGDGVALAEEVNIGLAMATDAGLTVPVVHRADRLNLRQLATRRKELIERAQEGKLEQQDVNDGTFTISNLGMYGVDRFNAIVNPPQAAILALGQIADRVVPVDGQPAVRPMVTLTLSCDHRAIDGAMAAPFLQTLVGFIEDPMQMLLSRA
ncbi:MAG: 2-oxo acid dehydrogenase subunit E2 [Gemmatimonadetes bacterium]|nr:2-oxo acid dehydrogenase subunit E2 [Gemmatimonadota bacterium]